MITFIAIKAAQAKAQRTKKDIYMTDDPKKRVGWRLGLRCMPSGSATWFFRYTHNGKRDKPITLGHLRNLDIIAARRVANDLADIHIKNSDVSGKLQADEQAKQIAINENKVRAMLDEQSRQALGCYTLARLMAVYVAYLQRCGRSKSAADVVSLSKHLASISDKPAAAVLKAVASARSPEQKRAKAVVVPLVQSVPALLARKRSFADLRKSPPEITARLALSITRSET